MFQTLTDTSAAIRTGFTGATTTITNTFFPNNTTWSNDNNKSINKIFQASSTNLITVIIITTIFPQSKDRCHITFNVNNNNSTKKVFQDFDLTQLRRPFVGWSEIMNCPRGSAFRETSSTLTTSISAARVRCNPLMQPVLERLFILN
jgi:hypothetical protein